MISFKHIRADENFNEITHIVWLWSLIINNLNLSGILLRPVIHFISNINQFFLHRCHIAYVVWVELVEPSFREKAKEDSEYLANFLWTVPKYPIDKEEECLEEGKPSWRELVPNGLLPPGHTRQVFPHLNENVVEMTAKINFFVRVEHVQHAFEEHIWISLRWSPLIINFFRTDCHIIDLIVL